MHTKAAATNRARRAGATAGPFAAKAPGLSRQTEPIHRPAVLTKFQAGFRLQFPGREVHRLQTQLCQFTRPGRGLHIQCAGQIERHRAFGRLCRQMDIQRFGSTGCLEHQCANPRRCNLGIGQTHIEIEHTALGEIEVCREINACHGVALVTQGFAAQIRGESRSGGGTT